jgi:hypothetical protein
MKRKMLLVVACAAALWSTAALAVPTPAEVTAADRAGDYPKAESMMREVIAAKPQSAKAHYLLAEILSKEHKFDDAAAQARQARELDPELKFAGDPERFRTFERALSRELAGPVGGSTVAPARMNTAPAAPLPVQAASSGIPGWVWVGGFALGAFLIFRAVSRRAVASNLASGGYAPQGGYGMQPGMQQPGYGPGNGPGYGGAPGGGLLRTGLAVAGGVAGGVLLEKMLEGNRHDNNAGGNNYGSQGGGYNDADQATRELDNRPIDYGSGSNDWGGDASGGSDNFTPSGGGDDGGGW